MRLALHQAAPRVRAAWSFYEQAGLGISKEGVSVTGDEDNNSGESEQEGKEVTVCENGAAWVDWYGERLCDVETLNARAAHDAIDAGASNGSGNVCVLISYFLNGYLFL